MCKMLTGQPAVERELALIKVVARPEKRAEIISLANVFEANVADVSANTIIIQITSTSTRVDSLLELLRPFGLVEMVRTGLVAMMRGNQAGIRHTPGAGNGNGVHSPNSNGHKEEVS